VTVDSHEISYPAHNRIKNYALLAKVLPVLLGRTFDVSVTYVDALHQDQYAWPDADTIAASKPDIVILHWSAFKEEGGGDCNPDPRNGSPAQHRCAERFVSLIVGVASRLNPSAAFIIYSRQPTLCLRGFKNNFYLLMQSDATARDAHLERRIALMAVTKAARGASLASAQSETDLKAVIESFQGPKRPFTANNLQGLCLLSTPS
jgi:hypothetical protein